MGFTFRKPIMLFTLYNAAFTWLSSASTHIETLCFTIYWGTAYGEEEQLVFQIYRQYYVLPRYTHIGLITKKLQQSQRIFLGLRKKNVPIELQYFNLSSLLWICRKRTKKNVLENDSKKKNGLKIKRTKFVLLGKSTNLWSSLTVK